MKKTILFLSFLTPIFTFGSIINIPADYPTIQQGINTATTGDTVLVAPGTYIENLYIASKNFTLASWYLTTNDTSYISQTIIDGNNDDRTVYFYYVGLSFLFTGFTVTNGFSYASGAGILVYNASPTISNLVITNNLSTSSAGGGGGIACVSDPFFKTTAPELIDVTISNNTANDGSGGGLYCKNYYHYEGSVVNPKLTNVLFINNIAARSGGGMACLDYAKADLTGVKFINNSAGYSGGGLFIITYVMAVNLFDVEFFENSSGGNGGAISCYSSFLKLENVTISYNSALNGGGIYLKALNVTFYNVLVHKNRAIQTGGGIYCNHTSPFLKNVTFAENKADTATAIYCSDGSNPLLISNILYGNKPQRIVFASTGTANAIRISYSLIQGGIHFVETNDNGTIEWGEGNLNRNPLFVGSGEHPFQISDNSWCIDAGDPDTTGLNNMIDLAGEPRLINDRVDMGAYEWNLMVGTHAKNKTEAHDAVVYPNPFTTTTTIAYELQEPKTVEITIYNQMGKQVYFIQEKQSPGKQQIVWNAKGLPSGMYYFTIQFGDEMAKGKMMVVR